MRLIAVAAACAAFTAHAQPLERDQLEAYVDGMVETAMHDHRVPGVVVSIVHRGEVVLEKGYGYARAADRIPVDPQRTLFRIASITKTFNATALMQLVERGLVDLDAPFPEYLPGIRFDLPHGVPRVRDLLTHSAGFEDSYFGHFWAIDEATDHELEAYVARYQPRQVRAPGDRVVYSNYGTSVIGLIVQRVSGMPYADYMEANVFRPLGMERTTVRDWPGEARDGWLPAELEADLAHSAVWTGGLFQAPRWAWAHRGMTPAGAVLSTAHEMTHYMRAQLARETLLAPETFATMHAPAIRNHPAVAASALGFWVNDAWGYRTIEHGGSIFGFRSSMVLVPDLELGVFVSTNASPGGRLSGAFARRVVGRFFEPRIELPDPAADPDSLAEYGGRFLPMRRGYTTVDKLGTESLVVGHNDQGYLTLTGSAGTERYVPAGADVFRNVDTGEPIAFTRDARGRPVQLHGGYGHNNFERIPAWRAERAPIHAAIGLGAALALWLLALAMTRHRRDPESTGERNARHLLHAMAATWVVFGLSFMTGMQGVRGLTARHFAHFPQGWDWGWIIAGPIAVALTALVLVHLVPVWRDRNWYWTRSVSYSLVAVAALLLSLALWDWNLIGLRVL